MESVGEHNRSGEAETDTVAAPKWTDEYVQTLHQWVKEQQAELTNKEMANATMYDQSLLTLSSSFLGGSLALLGKVVPTDSRFGFLENGAYVLFLLCIVLVIVSLIVGQRAIARQRQLYNEYRDGDFRDFSPLLRNGYARINNVVNHASGISFVAGLLCLTSYVMCNL